MSSSLSGRLSDLQNNPFNVDDYLLTDIGNDGSQISFRPSLDSKYRQLSTLEELGRSGFHACTWNCHLTSSYHEIFDFISRSNNLHIMALCETFLGHDTLLSSFNFPGYELIARSRSSMGRGGLAFIVRQDLNWKIRKDLDIWKEGKIETLSIEIQFENRACIFTVVYKPPSASFEEFAEGFECLAAKVNRSSQEFICMGDFNFDLLNVRGPNLDFLSLMMSNDLYPTVSIPTRITDHSETLIDNVFVSSAILSKAYCSVVISPASDHLPVVLHLNSEVKKHNRKNKIPMRELKPVNLKKFEEQISVINWETVLNEDHPSEAFEKFNQIVSNIYDSTCPLKETNPRKNKPRKPWCDDELLNLFNMRNQACEEHLNHPQNNELHVMYKELRNRANALRRKKKKAYFTNVFEESKGNPKATWQVVNDLLKGPMKPSEPKIVLNNRTLEETEEICNAFGQYFSEIGCKIQEEARSSHVFESSSFVDERGRGFEMHFQPCTEEEVRKIVSTIKSNSAGVDGMNLRTLKSVLVYLLPVLVYLINISMEKGMFPSALKIAKVVPLHKGGVKTDISNWRPISILPIYSKVYEKIVHHRLYEYLMKIGVLHDGQFGFRKGHSTTQAVQHLLENINSALENGEQCMGVFIDFRKAFDTVDFKILLERLCYLGIKGSVLNWFESYLSERKLRVTLSNKSSQPFPIKCGVPQGSVLGPLLYLIFVDTMRFYIPGASVTSFADDTALVIAAKSLQELLFKANKALDGLHEFVCASLLSVNASKTNFMMFTRTGSAPTLPGVIIYNGLPLSQVEEIRYLGFILDRNLSWRKHCDIIACKLARGLGVLNRFQNFLPLKILLLLYFSLIAPYINYGCLIWASNFSCNFRRVQVLQNKAIRLIGRYDRGIDSTESLFRKFKILKVGEIRDYQIGVFVFQCLNGLAPDFFMNIFKPNSFYHDYSTRSADSLASEPRNTTRASQVTRHMGPSVWNSFPDSVRQAESVPQLKTRIKNHFFSGIW